MNKILFITESYHVNPSPNGNCVEKIAGELTSRGVDVSVLALKNETAREAQVYDSVRVERVNTHLEWRVLFSKKLPRVIKRVLSGAVGLIKKLLIPWHPMHSPCVVSALTRRAERIVRREGIEVVVGVYRDFETAWSAIRLKRKHKNLKVIIYTLDAISGGVCSNKWVSERAHIKKCRRWEIKMLKECDLFCPMRSHKDLFASEEYAPYRDKIKYLDVPTLMINGVDYTKPEGETLNFTFTGMLSETNADCRFFLGILPRICERRNARFDIYGGVSEAILEAIKETGLYGKNIFFHGRVEGEALESARRNADVLLNFGNEHFCGIPCKIFEYMATGKSILSFYKIDNDASYPYLERYPKAYLLRECFGTEADAADKILEFTERMRSVSVSQDEVAGEFYSNTPRELADVIMEI